MVLKRDESGQAVTEYLLLLAVVASFFVVVFKSLSAMGLSDKIRQPLTQDFAHAYRYGHPKALGYDEGGPVMHPRVQGGNNFRLFINPGAQ